MNSLIGKLLKFGLIASIIILIITNPGMTQYEVYASDRLTAYLKDDLCVQLADKLKNPCYILVDTASPQIRMTVSQSTKQQNFVLFSIYKTELSIPSVTHIYHFATLGIFEKFFTYQAEKND